MISFAPLKEKCISIVGISLELSGADLINHLTHTSTNSIKGFIMKKFLMLAIALNCSSAFAGEGWYVGKIRLVESYQNSMTVRWTPQLGAGQTLTTVCPIVNGLTFKQTADSLVTTEAMNRAFSILSMAANTQKPVRFKLVNCEGDLAKATVVQLCADDPCWGT